MQLQIIDTKSLNSWVFENQLHVPRRGEVVRIDEVAQLSTVETIIQTDHIQTD